MATVMVQPTLHRSHEGLHLVNHELWYTKALEPFHSRQNVWVVPGREGGREGGGREEGSEKMRGEGYYSDLSNRFAMYKENSAQKVSML